MSARCSQNGAVPSLADAACQQPVGHPARMVLGLGKCPFASGHREGNAVAVTYTLNGGYGSGGGGHK